MEQFVKSSPKDYGESLYIFVKDITPAGTSLMTFISHKANFQDGLRRQRRKTQFLFALKRCLDELGIRFQLPEQNVKLIAPVA
jgi:hypothetical protein